jgi:hypothetical protein
MSGLNGEGFGTVLGPVTSSCPLQGTDAFAG